MPVDSWGANEKPWQPSWPHRAPLTDSSACWSAYTPQAGVHHNHTWPISTVGFSICIPKRCLSFSFSMHSSIGVTFIQLNLSRLGGLRKSGRSLFFRGDQKEFCDYVLKFPRPLELCSATVRDCFGVMGESGRLKVMDPLWL